MFFEFVALIALVQPHFLQPGRELKDRITPQVNFFQKWATNVVAGTEMEGKTQDVVEDREVKQVVCEELCVTKGYVKDGVRRRK